MKRLFIYIVYLFVFSFSGAVFVQNAPAFEMWSMGYNLVGQLGDGTTNDHVVPVKIEDSSAIAVDAGAYHTLYIKSGGSLWGMGYNNDGQLGDGTTVDRHEPIEIESSSVTVVAAGLFNSFYIKSDGSLWGMGDNSHGQLGDGTTDDRIEPIEIESSGVTDVAIGIGHCLYTKTDGSLWGVGWNFNGQLGDGTYGYLEDGTTQNRSLVPIEIIDSGVDAVAAGESTSFYIKSDGSLWGMGYNNNGQLGDGTTDDRHEPIEILDSGVNVISAFNTHTLYVKSDGSLWGMGNNFYGQLGDGTYGYLEDGTTENRSLVPIKIIDSGVNAADAGAFHSFYLKSGSLWGMGYNVNGQLGDGTTTDRHRPLKIGNGVISASGGLWHSCFVSNRFVSVRATSSLPAINLLLLD